MASLDVLAQELAGSADREAMSNRWREVHPTDVSSFGADAAAIGVPQK